MVPPVGLEPHFHGASSGTRTHTLTILSRLPLPLGYGGELPARRKVIPTRPAKLAAETLV